MTMSNRTRIGNIFFFSFLLAAWMSLACGVFKHTCISYIKRFRIQDDILLNLVKKQEGGKRKRNYFHSSKTNLLFVEFKGKKKKKLSYRFAAMVGVGVGVVFVGSCWCLVLFAVEGVFSNVFDNCLLYNGWSFWCSIWASVFVVVFGAFTCLAESAGETSRSAVFVILGRFIGESSGEIPRSVDVILDLFTVPGDFDGNKTFDDEDSGTDLIDSFDFAVEWLTFEVKELDRSLFIDVFTSAEVDLLVNGFSAIFLVASGVFDEGERFVSPNPLILFSVRKSPIVLFLITLDVPVVVDPFSIDLVYGRGDCLFASLGFNWIPNLLATLSLLKAPSPGVPLISYSN
jgi:hypothetical protein